MSVVLRQVIPDGTKYGRLGEFFPDWTDLTFGQDMTSEGSLTFTYANDGANFTLLKEGVYITPLIDGNRIWKDSIFFVQEMSGTKTPGADSRKSKFAGVSLKARLDEVRWMPAVGSTFMDGLAFKYINYTPGQIIKTGVENFWSRSKSKFGDPTYWLQSVEVAPGTVWTHMVDEVIEPTTSVYSVIKKYQDVGIATAWFDGFSLQVSHYDRYKDNTNPGTDKTDSVQFRVGVNLLSTEYAQSNKDLYTAVLVKGMADPFGPEATDTFQPGNTCEWVIAPQGVIDKWGYRETVLDVSTASTSTTLRAVGEAYLKGHIEPRYSTSYTMVDHLYDSRTGEELPTPSALSDFECGDLITIVDSDGASSQRVYAIAMDYSSPNKGNLVLTVNDLFMAWSEVFDQRLKRLEGTGSS